MPSGVPRNPTVDPRIDSGRCGPGPRISAMVGRDASALWGNADPWQGQMIPIRGLYEVQPNTGKGAQFMHLCISFYHVTYTSRIAFRCHPRSARFRFGPQQGGTRSQKHNHRCRNSDSLPLEGGRRWRSALQRTATCDCIGFPDLGNHASRQSGICFSAHSRMRKGSKLTALATSSDL